MDNDTLDVSKGHGSLTNKQTNRTKSSKKKEKLYKMLSRSLNATSRLKKRERTQNWAFEEKRYLLELCKRDMNIIENKRLDADLTALKNRAWKSVHEEFCKVFGNERNCNRLKEQWRRMKGKFYYTLNSYIRIHLTLDAKIHVHFTREKKNKHKQKTIFAFHLQLVHVPKY